MIALNQVSAGYGNGNVLNDISFQLNHGENLSIIGPNGCGKTTLLRAIASTIPFTGEISLNGNEVKRMKRKEMAKQVAMFSQITHSYFNYTVFDTVMMGRYVHEETGIFGRTSEKDYHIAEEVLKAVGMYELRNREVDTLSGGQLQRVFLGKVLAQEPDIILLDEPTNHLDLSCQIELIGFLKEWSKQENKTVVGVLHDINLAMLLTDNILLLENGRVRAYGTKEEILSSSVLSDVYKINIPEYMLKTLRIWEEVTNGQDKFHAD